MNADGGVQPVEHDGEESATEGREHSIHPHAELSTGSFSEIVNVAAQAATMAVFAALGSGTLRLPHSAPAPPSQPAGTNENQSSDENQSETGASQPFQRACPCIVSA